MLYGTFRRYVFGLGFAAGASALALPASAQTVVRPGTQERELPDSAHLHGGARREQRLFESRRFHYLPVTFSSGGSGCDEIVGRFCVWWNESPDWTPEPEAPDIRAYRDTLLARLDSIQRLVPGDDWVLGQRVWYRAEAGDWADALETARSCEAVTPWWCSALRGFALHGLGRYAEAETAFDTALALMPAVKGARWKVPRRAVDGAAARLLSHAASARRDTLLERLWLLADPLWLVPGNDRLTAHYARWTVATLREGAANPHGISWGSDMEELMVRNGWETSWERARNSSDITAPDLVVGHEDPEGRDFMPPASALAHPSSATESDLMPGITHPRSLYQPPYAPVLLPMDGQLAVFPEGTRGDSMAVVATAFVPPDTTEGAREDRPRPWMRAGDEAGRPDREGLFLQPASGGPRVRIVHLGRGPIGLLLRAPAGHYVVSVEAWSPPHRTAGRLRRGLRRDTVPPDVAMLSDLLLVRSTAPEPLTLDAAAAAALPRAQVGSGEAFRLVWELGGTGWRPGQVTTYSVSVERADAGLLRRAGELLHVVGRERPLALHWSEPGPAKPSVVLRSVELNLPDTDPGAYRIRLEARLEGRAPLVSEVVFRVVSR